MNIQVLDTGSTNLNDLNVRSGISFTGGNLGNNWQDKQKHGTHVSAAGMGAVPHT
jgi:hypothetical protein